MSKPPERRPCLLHPYHWTSVQVRRWRVVPETTAQFWGDFSRNIGSSRADHTPQGENQYLGAPEMGISGFPKNMPSVCQVLI